jgi:hypothetical protein
LTHRSITSWSLLLMMPLMQRSFSHVIVGRLCACERVM